MPNVVGWRAAFRSATDGQGRSRHADIGSEFAADYAISVAGAFGAHMAGVAFIYEPVIPDDALGGISSNLIDIQRQGASEELLIEGALFGSGRPVGIVPVIQSRGLTLERVLVCWDGSRPAARAIADAMPFLTRAKAVDILVVTGERDRSGEITGKNMRAHLARHDIQTEIKQIKGADAQNAIQSHAAAIGADFMVMGGYHHSRLREFILGGVTRGILKSMTVPVFMSR